MRGIGGGIGHQHGGDAVADSCGSRGIMEVRTAMERDPLLSVVRTHAPPAGLSVYEWCIC